VTAPRVPQVGENTWETADTTSSGRSRCRPQDVVVSCKRFFFGMGRRMGENPLSVLAIACSIGALAASLVVLMRSTPQRVRKAALAAAQMAEETQNAVTVMANRMVSFMEEVTRERTSAAGDLEEAERKRRQAAAKLSKVENSKGEPINQPQTLREALESLPVGDPRRMSLLRRASTAAQEGH